MRAVGFNSGNIKRCVVETFCWWYRQAVLPFPEAVWAVACGGAGGEAPGDVYGRSVRIDWS